MKFEVRIGNAIRTVEIGREDSGRLGVELGGLVLNVDAAELSSDTYSLLVDGCAFEAHLFPAAQGLTVRCGGQEFAIEVRDPRAWGGQRSAVAQAEGRQQVVSPMPGKVVRVLVASGDTVEAEQGLVVVEAMKMQNEIRAPKSGSVERVYVREGQTVAAGEALISIV